MNATLKKLDPAVDKRILIMISGCIWSIVGILLCYRAAGWLSGTSGQQQLLPGVTGLVLAFCIYRFGFLNIVNKNIDRIRAKKGKVCIFGFQPWKSYVIIIIMVELGNTLRHSALPKQYLAIIYIGFGGAMLLSSLRYYGSFISLIGKKDSEEKM